MDFWQYRTNNTPLFLVTQCFPLLRQNSIGHAKFGYCYNRHVELCEFGATVIWVPEAIRGPLQ